MTLQPVLEKLLNKQDLTSDEASAALNEIVTGDVDPAVTSAFLVALRAKGETPDEIAGLAQTMRNNVVAVTPKSTGTMDTCGTGGDGTKTANISTTVAFIVAGAGVPVAKHGNRALSSSTGSADVLEALGIPLDLDAPQVARCIDEAGIGFMFAPAFHPAMAKVMPVRRAIGVRTAFNVLGPMTNPARPAFQLVGVGAPHLVDLVAGAFAKLDLERVIVVHGAGGADELTCAGPNVAVVVEGGEVTPIPLDHNEARLADSPLEALRGGEPRENADTLRATLEGKAGPILDCVLFNAGTAFIACGKAGRLHEGVELAREVIASGAGVEALDRFVKVANSV
jgi:anthranilate phosphoribosyltransferase